MEAQYVVLTGPGTSAHLYLKHGDSLHRVDQFSSMGEALAKARQLQNRLAWVVKDPDFGGSAHLREGYFRERRLPWEVSSRVRSLYSDSGYY